MDPATAKALDFVADAFNPILLLAALALPLLSKRKNWPHLRGYYAATALGIAFVYLFKAVESLTPFWQSLHHDYSTHSALAASAAVSLACFRPHWTAALGIALILYYALERWMAYHTVAEILLAGCLLGLLTWGAHRILRQPEV